MLFFFFFGFACVGVASITAALTGVAGTITAGVAAARVIAAGTAAAVVAAYVGIDWADKKHDLCIQIPAEGTQEFKVPGYYQASNLVRRAGAGGLMVMVKTTIKIHAIVKKNVLPEIQVIQFEFNGQTIISVYRSPTVKLMSVPEREHHETLIEYLKVRIKKLKGKPYYLVGDFNLGDLAKCDFNPDPRISGFEDDLPTKT